MADIKCYPGNEIHYNLVVYNHWTGMVEWNSGTCSTG